MTGHQPPPPGSKIVRGKRCEMCGEEIPVYLFTKNDGTVVEVSTTNGCPVVDRAIRGFVAPTRRRTR